MMLLSITLALLASFASGIFVAAQTLVRGKIQCSKNI